MDENRKRLLVNVLACAAKMATIAVPHPALQVVLQESVDRLRDKLVETTDEMPKINDILCAESLVIRTIVKDILSAPNALQKTENLCSFTSNQLASNLVKHSAVISHISEDEAYQAEAALTRYLTALKEWGDQQPDLLREQLEYVGLKLTTHEQQICSLGVAVEGHKKRLDDHQKQLNSQAGQLKILSNVIRPQHPAVDIASHDAYKKDPQLFYLYFRNDPAISVENFFLCQNYKKLVLNSDNNTLNMCFQNTSGEMINLDEIIAAINDQRLLLVTGMYGTGKTALLKKLHSELRKYHGDNAFFFRTKDLIDVIDCVGFTNQSGKINHSVMDEAFLKLSNGQNMVYIFIDELDELNIDIQSSSYLNAFLMWLCEFVGNNESFRFILGSRKYSQISNNAEVCVADNLFLEYFSLYESNLAIVYADSFSSITRSKWVEEYAFAKEKYTTYSQIKDEYGQIVSAMKTPIFLYAFMQRYLSDSGKHESMGYYYYYSSFIDKTAGGKFGLQHTKKIKVGVEPDLYRSVLQEIAFLIMQQSEDYLTEDMHSKAIWEEQPLLADELTNRKFEIPLEKVEKLLVASKCESANFVNCYFFNMDKHRVYFTDTNILFALAAEYIFNAFEDIVISGKSEFNLEDLHKIKLLRLYPHLVDYIIFLAKKSEYADKIVAYLDSFVRNPMVKSFHIDLSCGNQKPGVVDKVLLLYILFIKQNKHSYGSEEYQHILRELGFYTNAYKTHRYLSDTSEYVYTIERYFMNLALHQITLKRLNFKYYNFKDSKITDECLFHQCKFNKTNMHDVIMDGVRFKLCEFLHVRDFSMRKLEKHKDKFLAIFDCCNISQCSISSQAICFRNCKIDGLQLVMIGERAVVFENCFIKNLRIEINNNLRSNPPVFTRCIFETIPVVSPFSEKEIKELIFEGKGVV